MADDLIEKAEAQFTEWFVKNYPGPDTIIGKPEWHAPRIFTRARAALEAVMPGEPVAHPAPEPGEELERVARAICAEGCAFRGEPPCWEIAPDEWPSPECNEPGCMALARAALAEGGGE